MTRAAKRLAVALRTAGPKRSTRISVKSRAPVALAPPPRRAIFIDVENTSSEDAVARILDHLQIDRKAQRTDLFAVGNWKAVGIRLGRLLAAAGAHLVHSAPASGIRDWSDLWIAVAAGRWIAHADPGDVLDLVSDDRAFDAVGDAAAAAGVVFHRITYRSLGVEVPAPEATAIEEPARRRSRGGRRRRGRGPMHAAHSPVAPAPHPRPEPLPAGVTPVPVQTHPTPELEPHTASLEQIRNTLARLGGGDPERWINLDALANALKAEGFSRPPGSPRLITRLRSIHGVAVSPSGMVRLSKEGMPAAAMPEAEPVAAELAEALAEPAPPRGTEASAPAPAAAGADGETSRPRRTRRGGGRRSTSARGRRQRSQQTETAAPAESDS